MGELSERSRKSSKDAEQAQVLRLFDCQPLRIRISSSGGVREQIQRFEFSLVLKVLQEL